jgi:hypothetical protein
MAGVETKLSVQDYELLVNIAGAKLIHANLMWLGPIQYKKKNRSLRRQLACNRCPGEGIKRRDPTAEEPRANPDGAQPTSATSWIVPTLPHVCDNST